MATARTHPLILEMNFGLPPGTDSLEQYEQRPRMPQPPPKPHRELPPWPPRSTRRGHWIEKYLDELDPETEYDHIIRTVTLFKGSAFASAVSYAAIFAMLTMPPSGATAIHGRKVVKCGHRRFYETELQIVNWAYYGSNSPETSRSIDSVNKLHAGIWKEHPGSFSTLWEGQMSTIAPSYLETWMRSLVGARKKDIHPKVQASWPKWSEGVLSHFHTETANGKRSYGINHPRSWDEIKDFFFWFNSIPFDKQATPEQRRKGHETAEHFIQQFSELWFPRGLSWLGRQIILTFLPQHCRQQQMLGEPNLIASFGIKLFFKAMFDIGDLLPDPVDPPLIAFRQSLMDVDLLAVDTQVKAKRSKEDTIIKSVLFFALALMSCILFSFK